MAFAFLMLAALQPEPVTNLSVNGPLVLVEQRASTQPASEFAQQIEGLAAVRCGAMTEAVEGWRISCRQRGGSATVMAVDGSGREMPLGLFAHPVAAVAAIGLHGAILVRVARLGKTGGATIAEYRWMPPPP